MAASALHGMLEFTCFNWHSQMLDYPDAAVNDVKAVDTLYTMIARVLELDDTPVPAKAAIVPKSPAAPRSRKTCASRGARA